MFDPRKCMEAKISEITSSHQINTQVDGRSSYSWLPNHYILYVSVGVKYVCCIGSLCMYVMFIIRSGDTLVSSEPFDYWWRIIDKIGHINNTYSKKIHSFKKDFLRKNYWDKPPQGEKEVEYLYSYNFLYLLFYILSNR